MVGTNRGLYDRKIKKEVHDPKMYSAGYWSTNVIGKI